MKYMQIAIIHALNFLKGFKNAPCIYVTDIADVLHVKTHEINQLKRYVSRHKHDILLGGGGVVVKIDNYFFYKVKRISTYSLSRRNDLRVDSGILSSEKKGEWERSGGSVR